MKTLLLFFASLCLCLVARAESSESIRGPLKTDHSWIYDGAHIFKDAEAAHRLNLVSAWRGVLGFPERLAPKF